MKMSNIEIGIDLGTTNSEISILSSGKAEIVKNYLGDEYTPSVFGVKKDKNEIVGRKAYEALYNDASDDNVNNTKAEVKRIMGTTEKVTFTRNEVSYTPEEISAEILKSLKKDAISKKNDINANGVVITIPAHFSTIQSEATKRAGILAGFRHVVLLQEPIAAAISYGFNHHTNENWLVYDLGGGTFDVALISSKDGNLKVLSHNGDNFLGGKDIDYKIIDEVVIPAIVSKYKLVNFNRGNSKLTSVFAKIKYNVEQAKIQLSRDKNTEIEIDGTIDGEEVSMNIPLSIDVLEDMCTSMVNSTIKLCKNTISESGINPSSINKIILVGGPTQLPFIRKRLEEELNIKVDTETDPLTAVAKGACIYGASQRIPDELSNDKKEKKLDEYVVKLEYESLSSEEDELVTGAISELENSENNYYIQIQNDSNTFNSGRIKLKKGKFVASVILESKKTNTFWVYLFDEDGNSLPISNESFSITQGLSVSGSPIPNSIGVAIFKKDVTTGMSGHVADWFFRKNEILPLSKEKWYKTVRDISKNDTFNALPIIVFEGESENPDRNTFICNLAITGDMLPHDLLKGSDVKLTISIDESRSVEVTAYLPDIDKEINARATIFDETIDIHELRKDLSEERERFETVNIFDENDEVDEIKDNLKEISNILYSQNSTEDDKRKANSKLKRVKTEIDKLVKENSFESLVLKFDIFKKHSEKIKENAKIDKNIVDKLISEGEDAIEQRNEKKLAYVLDEVENVRSEYFMNSKELLMAYLAEISENEKIKYNSEAQYFIQKAVEAYKNNDTDTIRKCVYNIVQM